MFFQPKKILVIKLRAIGDVVLSTIVLENLQRAFPKAKIDFLTEKPAQGVVEDNKYINSVIVLDRNHIASLPLVKRLLATMTFLKKLSSSSYDLVFDFFGNPRSAFLTMITHAGVRVGYDFRIRRLAYNVVVTSRADQVHEAEFHLDALKVLGIPIVSKKLSFSLPKSALGFAREFWQSHKLNGKFVVAINFGGGWSAKRWPMERFAVLSDELVSKLGAEIVIVWGPGEYDHALKLKSLMAEQSHILPPSDLKQLGAVFKMCNLTVSTDSGPMHISAAVGTPTVGIFGPTNSDLQGPYGDQHDVAKKDDLDCLGCNLVECDHNSCMVELEVKEVWQTVVRCMVKNKMPIASSLKEAVVL
jgi:ADP-heptose:LPS heptosyltransferase